MPLFLYGEKCLECACVVGCNTVEGLSCNSITIMFSMCLSGWL